MGKHVVTIGGGFSGTLFAVNLVRQGDHRVTLIERGGEPGRGLAYGAAHPTHLLNVRAGNMSAFPDAPDHFARWLTAQWHAEAATMFAPRLVYGSYIQELLGAETSDGRLRIVRGEVESLTLTGTEAEVLLGGGERIIADAAVLAMGNAPPQTPRGIEPLALPLGTYIGDPWQPGVADGLTDEDDVLVIGTGLTMVDIALLLKEKGFGGPITALSRRGLLPRAHAAGPSPEQRSDALVAEPLPLLRHVRRRAQAVGWRAAVDELRPVTQALWRDASVADRGRFLRHLRPYWDVHRHRIAPEIHQRLHAMIHTGQLRAAAGKIVGVEAQGGRVIVTWRPRGSDGVERLQVSRIINCTGPEANLRSTRDPLLHQLVADGTIRPDPLGIGIDVDQRSRTISPDGRPHPNLFALGPLTRGALWEIVAVPDIRKQAWDLARHVAAL